MNDNYREKPITVNGKHYTSAEMADLLTARDKEPMYEHVSRICKAFKLGCAASIPYGLHWPDGREIEWND